MHLFATLAMLIVGLALLTFYFTIQSKDTGLQDPDDQDKFDKLMAGILSLGSMFMAFSLGVLAVQRNLGDITDVAMKGEPAYDRYMIVCLLVGIVVLVLGGMALSTLNYDSSSATDDQKSIYTQLLIIETLAGVATLVSILFSIKTLTGKSFGFDFEF